jgi:RNA polymerase sigma factor (sigma-70 family)
MEELAQLVVRAQSGDIAAYTGIVQRFQHMAYGYASSLLGNFTWAEDAAQEAFIDAYRYLPDLREPAAFPGWFRRIVFKHCDRLLRERHGAETSWEDALELTSNEPGPAEAIARRELQDKVLAAIASLPDHDRIVTTLYYINGYSQKEVAEFLEVPVTTVKARLHTSRKQLKERMVDMVADTLKSNALPMGFTQETMDKVVAQAQELNGQKKYTEAEGLLREALVKVPDHAVALRELNRAITWGRVYGQGRWDLLPEIVAHGRAILAAGVDDEKVYHETAQTLLNVPAMLEAVEFIEGWIGKKGPGLMRLGMLSWGRSCLVQYEAAEATWRELVEFAKKVEPEQISTAISEATHALVDSLSAAREMARAERVAREGWLLWREARPAATRSWELTDWPYTFKQAGLANECESVAHAWFAVARTAQVQNAWAQAEAWRARVWYDDIESLIRDWLEWLKNGLKNGEHWVVREAGTAMSLAFNHSGRRDEKRQLALRTWELLENTPGEEAARLRDEWKHQLASSWNIWQYIYTGDLDIAERLAYEQLATGDQDALWILNDIAVRRGTPSPTELLREIGEKGAEASGHYGLFGWYLLAREAAATGDAEKAFAALRRASEYWCNPPLFYVKIWEQDTRWGELRNHPEFQRILDDKRRRIGPIYGELHYFPGW